MPVYDFSSGLGLLNQGISSLGDALGNRTDAQAFAQIGNALQNGRYDQAASLAWQAGKPDIAMKLQGMAFSMGAANQGYPGAGGDGTGTVPTSLTKEGGPQPTGQPQPAGTVTATPSKVGAGVGSGYDASGMTKLDVANYIRTAAAARNIDPAVALRVAQSEGLNTYIGDQGRSFGPYQLFTGGGLGNEFMHTTGLNPADPTTVKQQIDFALDTAARKGSWADWNGAKAIGLPMNAGLQGARPAGVSMAGGPSGAVQPTFTPSGTQPGTPAFSQPNAGVPPVTAGAPGPQAAAQPVPGGGVIGSANAAAAAPPPGGAPNALAAANQGPQPQGPPMSQVMLMQAIGSGQINERQLEANWRQFNLPDPGLPSSQQFWQALRNVPQGAGGARPAPTNVATAGPTQTPGGPQPTQLSPGGPGTPPTPTQPGSLAAPGFNPADAMGAPVTEGYTRGDLRTALTPGGAPTPTTPGAAPARAAPPGAAVQGPLDAQGIPRGPTVSPDSGVAKDVPAVHSPAAVPAKLQPKSSSSAPVDGAPSGPRMPGTGTTFAQDFGPGKGQVWGPGGNVLAARGPGGVAGPGGGDAVALGQQALARPGFDPTVAPFAQGTGAQPWRPDLPVSAFGPGAGGAPQSGAGAVPAALGGPGAGGAPPGAMPPPGGQARPAGLGAMLGGVPAGLLNLLSMQPPGGVPGLQTPAQRLGYGAPAPMPGQPGFPGVAPGGGGGAPAAAPMAAPPPTTTAAAQPVAQPAAAQPPADPALAQIDARIQAATQRELALRQYSQRLAFINPEMAKASEAEADKLSDQINTLVKERESRVSKSGETAETAVSGQATKRIEQLGQTHSLLTGATGVGAITDNINNMERNLNNAIAGYGTANNLWTSIATALAPYDPKFAGLAAGTQEFERRSTQELAQMAEQLFNQPGSRLTKQEYAALKDGTFKLADNPYVAYRLLEMSRQRALNLATQHNTNVESAAKAYGKYGGNEARDLYKVDITEDMKSPGKDYKPPPDPNAPGATSGTPGSSPNNRIKVNTPAEHAALKPGAYWTATNPDGTVVTGQK